MYQCSSKGEPLKPTWNAGTSPYKISSFKTAPQIQFQSRVHIRVSLSSTSWYCCKHLLNCQRPGFLYKNRVAMEVSPSSVGSILQRRGIFILCCLMEDGSPGSSRQSTEYQLIAAGADGGPGVLQLTSTLRSMDFVNSHQLL